MLGVEQLLQHGQRAEGGGARLSRARHVVDRALHLGAGTQRSAPPLPQVTWQSGSEPITPPFFFRGPVLRGVQVELARPARPLGPQQLEDLFEVAKDGPF